MSEISTSKAEALGSGAQWAAAVRLSPEEKYNDTDVIYDNMVARRQEKS
jgi:hypothetical protein